MELTIADIIDATDALVVAHDREHAVRTISTDTRTLQPGNWFIAIRGPHFDGHDFLADAAARGAVGCMVEREAPAPANIWCLRVANTIAALGAIAAVWRARFPAVPCVAVTGSNGKSTTKEMIAAVAAARGPVLKTEGNLNNLIGLPLTCFRWTAAHRTAVVEMGMSAKGEIARLTTIVRPDIGLVTNVTAAHLAQLLTVDNVAAAKGELLTTMRPDGTAVVNMEDPWVRPMGAAYPGRTITYGMRNGCDVQFGRMQSDAFTGMDLTVYLRGEERRLHLQVMGAHNVMNALAAMAVGMALELPAEVICERLPRFQPMQMRMERVQLANGVQVINDSYNANPMSVEAALTSVSAVKRAGRFIAVLGEMLELGPEAAAAHHRIGQKVQAVGADRLFVLGDHADAVAQGAIAAGFPAEAVATAAAMTDLQQMLLATAQSGDVVLVKGSRGMRMERVVDFLKHEWGTD